MFWIALAAQLGLPAPLGSSGISLPDIRAIFRVDDFPANLQRAGVSRAVYTRTTVRPDGATQGCVAEASSDDPVLDAYTCQLIVKRAKFRPATWTDGSPVYGVIRVPVSWVVSYAPPSDTDMLKVTVPDIDLSVNHLPKGAHSIVGVGLIVAADASGQPLSCAEQPILAHDKSKRRFPELVSIACQQVMSSFRVPPPVDASGKAVRSVQNVSVRFTKKR